MCGINGFNWPDNEVLRSMCRVTHNRGPDDQGYYTDNRVSLGHNRLSIIDLSPNGHQPMSNEDDSVWLIYNGEIYNFQDIRSDLLDQGHSFKSKTDSEVILHAYEEYGEECVRRFNGMWAFCIYDRNKNRLFLSRDRFGIKPLYYFADRERFIFSSMISAIRCHSIDTGPNDRVVMEYLAYNLLGHGEETFFDNIMSLPPGTNLMYDLDGRTVQLTKWHSLNESGEASAEQIRTAFTTSVRRRMLSDVQVGISQSGGMDSSAISCIFDSLHDGTFPTFSYVAPGASVDESRYIKELGKLIKAEQRFTTVDKDSFLQEIEDFTQAMEEPVSSVSVFASYRVMKLAREHGIKVILSGQGGDELFGGYVYYFGYLFYQLFRNLKWGKLLNEMFLYPRHFKSFYPHKLFFFLLSPAFMRQFAWRRWTNRWINHDYLEQLSQNGDVRWKRM
ncbi:MAG: asparagine synthase (glutamine-hydrolyzing), partial [Phycisphaerales bacterium]|nr:asparagine synthase (glutamine-hydrolyzing) [Phycisphaerales bacterium]